MASDYGEDVGAEGHGFLGLQIGLQMAHIGKFINQKRAKANNAQGKEWEFTGKEHLAQGGISQEKGEERQEEERERRGKQKKGGKRYKGSFV